MARFPINPNSRPAFWISQGQATGEPDLDRVALPPLPPLPPHHPTPGGDYRAVVERLLAEPNIDVDANSYLRTALYFAVETDNVEFADLLLQHGANQHWLGGENVTPRMLVRQRGNPEMVALFESWKG